MWVGGRDSRGVRGKRSSQFWKFSFPPIPLSPKTRARSAHFLRTLLSVPHPLLCLRSLSSRSDTTRLRPHTQPSPSTLAHSFVTLCGYLRYLEERSLLHKPSCICRSQSAWKFNPFDVPGYKLVIDNISSFYILFWPDTSMHFYTLLLPFFQYLQE